MSGVIDKGWEAQRRVEARAKQIGKGRYGRVLKMARKPTAQEYSRVVMITGIGITIIGAVGFVIYYIMGPGWAYIRSLFGLS